MNINEILPNFKNLKEYREFLDQLVEKKADGQEIARGMDKHDKSKDQKANTFVSKEVKKNANGGATEKHYDQVDQSLVNPPPEPEEPPVPIPPGQQVNIGNKTVDMKYAEPKTIDLEAGSGEKDKIELKPRIDLLKTKM